MYIKMILLLKSESTLIRLALNPLLHNKYFLHAVGACLRFGQKNISKLKSLVPNINVDSVNMKWK
jgi:hypothetical protein